MRQAPSPKKVFFAALSVLSGALLATAVLACVEVFFQWNARHHLLAQHNSRTLERGDESALAGMNLDYLKKLEPRKKYADDDEQPDYSGYTAADCPDPPPSLIHDTLWLAKPNCRTHGVLVKYFSRRIVHDIHMSFDEYSRRVIPAARPDSKEFLLFLGDSTTWGQGVEDQDTFANLVVKNFGRPVNGYNLGMAAWGPAFILRLLRRKRDLRTDGIQGERGIALYTLDDYQVTQIAGTLAWFRGHDTEFQDPAVFERDKKLRMANWAERRPMYSKIMRLLARSATLSYFNVDYPVIGPKDLELFAKLLGACKKILADRFHVSRFIVSIYPGEFYFADRLIPLLKAQGIIVFDYSRIDIERLMNGENNFPGDNHPTPLAHRFYADLLLRDLKAAAP